MDEGERGEGELKGDRGVPNLGRLFPLEGHYFV